MNNIKSNDTTVSRDEFIKLMCTSNGMTNDAAKGYLVKALKEANCKNEFINTILSNMKRIMDVVMSNEEAEKYYASYQWQK